MLSIEKIDSLEGLESLHDDWNGLLHQSGSQCLSLTHEWMLNWWKHFGRGKKLCVLLVREGGQLVLIAPLMKHIGLLHRKTLKCPVRVIETMANYHSNRGELIGEAGNPRYLDFLWDYLNKYEQWHVLRFFPFDQASAGFKRLVNLVDERQLRANYTVAHTSPYLKIEGSWSDYTGQLPKKITTKVRRAERSEVTWQLITKPTDLDRTMDQIFTVSEKGWAADHGTAISSNEQLVGFYGELARIAGKRGWLFLGLLKIHGSPIAYEFNLLYEKVVYNLKMAFDPDHKRLSPGHVLKYRILEELFKNRQEILEYNFLGEAAPYKMMWTNSSRRYLKTHLFRPHSAYAALLYGVQSLLRVHPRLREKIQSQRAMRTLILEEGPSILAGLDRGREEKTFRDDSLQQTLENAQ